MFSFAQNFLTLASVTSGRVGVGVGGAGDVGVDVDVDAGGEESFVFGGSLFDVDLRDDEDSCRVTFPDIGIGSDVDRRKKFRGGFHTPLVAVEPSSGAVLAKELTQLSVREREEVFADLHGVADIVEETPDFLDAKFEELEREICSIKKRGAYEKSLFLDADYVQSRDFRIKFLRADQFDPQKAAQRIVNHFEFKMELFGYAMLARDITYEDLKEVEQRDALLGAYWFLKNRDRSGRKIILSAIDQIYALDSTHISLLWYLYMVSLEDPETQKNGIVLIVHATERSETVRLQKQKPAFQLQIINDVAKLFHCLPMRLVAVHVCYHEMQSPPPFLSFFQMAVELKYRVRFRLHHGSPVENKYELGGYGIPVQLLPLDDEGNLDLVSYLDEFDQRIELEKQRKLAKEAAAKESGLVDHPSPYDVLLGRGRPYQVYPGNIHLAKVVEQNQSAYESGDRNDKAVLTKHVIDQIRQQGGKFLRRPERQQQEGQQRARKLESIVSSNLDVAGTANVDVEAGTDAFGWEEVDDETIKVKVGNTFRTKRKLEKRKEQGGTKRKST